MCGGVQILAVYVGIIGHLATWGPGGGGGGGECVGTALLPSLAIQACATLKIIAI